MMKLIIQGQGRGNPLGLCKGRGGRAQYNMMPSGFKSAGTGRNPLGKVKTSDPR